MKSLDNQTIVSNWNSAYPADQLSKLWPSEPNPAVKVAARFFRHGAIVLDLPCGDGKNIPDLLALGPVIAADASERAVSLVKLPESRPGQLVRLVTDVYGSCFASESFESIFCCDLLGHLPNPVHALREMRRILTESGLMVLTFFSPRDSVLGSSEMVSVGKNMYIYKDKFFFRFYEKDEIECVCNECELDVMEIVELTWDEGPHPGYREYAHSHTSWCVVVGRKS